MPTLFYIFPFLILHLAVAAPTGLQSTLATTVPEVLRPLLQETIDFINPHHPPSLKQTFISCLVFLFISLHVLYPFSSENARRLKLSKLRYGIIAISLGLISPDSAGYMAYRTAFSDFFIAVWYNLKFRTKDRKKKWTGAHVAFLRHGGFVLQDDGKPNKVLKFDDLVRMLKAKEIERPDVSRADILARSIRPSTLRRVLVYLVYFPIFWFAKKFISKLPLLVVFVGLHAVLTWVTLVSRSILTTGIKNPIIVVRKVQEEPRVHEEPVLGDDVNKLAGVSESKDTMDPTLEDEKVAEDFPVVFDSKETDGVQSTSPLPNETRHWQLGTSVMWLLALPFQLIALVLGVVFVFLADVYCASNVLLELHWKIISGPCHLGTFGSYFAMFLESFVTWIGFVVLSWRIPFDLERKIWTVSSLFLLLQPLLLLLVRPQRIRTRINERIKRAIYDLYTFIYAVARISIPFVAVYSIRYIM